MDPQTLRQLRGTTELVTDIVDGTTSAIADAHLAIAGHPYAVLARLGPLAGPAQVVEQAQMGITRGAYRAVRGTNRLVRTVAGLLFDQFEESA